MDCPGIGTKMVISKMEKMVFIVQHIWVPYWGTLHTSKNVPQSPLLGGVSVSPALLCSGLCDCPAYQDCGNKWACIKTSTKR